MVFLFILGILIVIFISSKFSIRIINLKFESQRKRYTNEDYKIILKWYILGKIPIIKINITKTKLEKSRIKNKLKQVRKNMLKDKNKFDVKLIKGIKKININIKKINLNIEIGTENAALTSIIIPTVSTVFAILLRKKMMNLQEHIITVNPIFVNQNLINIYASGIFEVKLINIINMILD